MSPPKDPDGVVDAATHRRLGVNLFNHVWALLDKSGRTANEDFEMLHAAHASLWHWSRPGVGGPVNLVRGEWQVSRVYATLGRSEPALGHGRRCLALCEAHGIGGFDLAFAHEAIARAAAVAGDDRLRDQHLGRAREAAQSITDAGDREHTLTELASIPQAPAGGRSPLPSRP
ncbi:MAG: hypothetical protein ACF8R7_09475 [Phycisphaerales bacterium JB039]